MPDSQKIRLNDLVTSTARLSDDTLELVDLSLSTAESTELRCELVYRSLGFRYRRLCSTYSLLGELTGTLVLGVTEQLNDSALVGGEAVKK